MTIKGRGVAGVRHRLIPVDVTIAPDAEMEALVESVMAPHRSMLAEVVGNTAVGLHRNANLYSPMDDVLLAAIAKVADTEIAFSNGWRYGAPIPAGPITLSDLWNIIPTNPPVSRVEMYGSEIRQMMEENLERTFSSDPFEQMGGYLKRVRGLTIYGKIENPIGHRIEHIYVGDVALAPEQSYRVAFVTAQAVPQKFGRNRRDLPVKTIDALRSYFLVTQAPPHPAVGRFLVV